MLRYDRVDGNRLMCISAASLLQAEYPDNLAHTDRWSYPRLAEELRRIGAPTADRIELFGRMVFNAVCGNDDDHVRNHAAVYQHGKSWRLSPAFDVVPNPADTPNRLTLQLSTRQFNISRQAVLTDSRRFGFTSLEEASNYLDRLLERIVHGFYQSVHLLPQDWQETMKARMHHNLSQLSSTSQ